MLCAQLQEPSHNEKEKKMVLTIEQLMGWPLKGYTILPKFTLAILYPNQLPRSNIWLR